MRQANQKPSPQTRDRTTQCTIQHQTITTLRKVSASIWVDGQWVATRLIGATTAPGPALESTCVLCGGGGGGGGRKESAKGLRWLLYVVTCIGFLNACTRQSHHPTLFVLSSLSFAGDTRPGWSGWSRLRKRRSRLTKSQRRT